MLIKERAITLAELVEDKKRLYGDSVLRVARIMAVLYPDGVHFEQYKTAFVLVRLLDKVCRLSSPTLDDPEDQWEDIAGYALRMMEEK